MRSYKYQCFGFVWHRTWLIGIRPDVPRRACCDLNQVELPMTASCNLGGHAWYSTISLVFILAPSVQFVEEVCE